MGSYLLDVINYVSKTAQTRSQNLCMKCYKQKTFYQAEDFDKLDTNLFVVCQLENFS